MKKYLIIDEKGYPVFPIYFEGDAEIPKGAEEITDEEETLFLSSKYRDPVTKEFKDIPPQELSDEDRIEREANSTRDNLQTMAVNSMMRMLAGNDITDDKYEYQTQLMSISDAVALKMPDVFPEWSEASVFYRKDMKLTYNGVLYKVLQDHTSQASWTPDAAPSLFAKVLVTGDEDTPPEWQQPDSTNAYMTGDRVTFEGHVYESLIDNNVWSPAAYPQGWKLINEGEE